MIKIQEIKLEEFDDIYNALVELQYQNSCIHYPDKEINIETQTKPTISSIKEYIRENKAFLFVAKELCEVVGFLWCYPRVFFDENRIYINSLIVKEEYRGKHIGSLLIEKAENKARQLKCDCIYVSTPSFNENALKFYRKQNYQDERIQLVKKLRIN